MQRDFITILISLISLAFAALLPFGTNVPLARRSQLTRYLVLVNVAVHVVTQIIDCLLYTSDAADDLSV